MQLHPVHLRDDDRGAILVIGLGMSAVLVGLLWYVIGVGNIIWFRERAQEAADTAAFSGAVVHARGMNLIVLINVVMAAILSIRVVLKFLQIALGVAIAVATVADIFTAGATTGAVTAATTAERNVTQALSDTKKPIDNAIKGLHKIGTLLPKAVPTVALFAGPKMAAHLEDTDSKNASAMGAPLRRQDSIVDTSLTPSFGAGGVDGFLSDGAAAVPSFVKPLQGFALPVADDDPAKLCRMAGGAVGELLHQVLDRVGLGGITVVTDVITNAAEGIAGSANEYFCENGSGLSTTPPSQSLPTVSDAQIQSQCDAKKAKADADGSAFDMDKCKKDLKDQVDQKTSGAVDQAGSADTSGDKSNMNSFKVAGRDGKHPFVNGGPDAQLFAAIRLKTSGSFLGEGARGVRVAVFGGKAEGEKAPFPYAFAQSEYYYDDGGPWSGLSDDALWNFRWRARLRRVGTGGGFADDAAKLLAAPELAKVFTAAGGAATDAPTNVFTEESNLTRLATALEHPVVH